MALATGLEGTLFADAPDASAYGSPETAEPSECSPAELVVYANQPADDSLINTAPCV